MNLVVPLMGGAIKFVRFEVFTVVTMKNARLLEGDVVRIL
jgi:hypothetical protein